MKNPRLYFNECAVSEIILQTLTILIWLRFWVFFLLKLICQDIFKTGQVSDNRRDPFWNTTKKADSRTHLKAAAWQTFLYF